MTDLNLNQMHTTCISCLLVVEIEQKKIQKIKIMKKSRIHTKRVLHHHGLTDVLHVVTILILLFLLYKFQ